MTSVPEPCVLPVLTVAVKVTLWPALEEFGAEVSEVLVAVESVNVV